ncbi:MAG TPA: 2-(1,2-epoxy-1,2-dihydrophenyl)acetyl-CoA isomerase [Bacteroidetes bacterium]|nr:2-(1,2-epoxy-1,2-dihydrophenyl)acetyl-CoA isomerase [Bacteroidota bacterium]
MFKTIKYNLDDRVATISLNRPDNYNAFNKMMREEFLLAIKKAKNDKSVRVIVITGEGKAFCSGQDLKEVEDADFRFEQVVKEQYNPIIKRLHTTPKPIICRLNGVAAGAGCSIALACDLIVMSEKASLIEVFVNIGLVLDTGSSYFLPRLVGSTKAFELASMGTKVGASEALRLNMINKAVPHEKLDEAVKEYTDFYKNAPTKAISLIKGMLKVSLNSNLKQMLDEESRCQEIAANSEDYTEGLNAFLEKRSPNFKGR